MSFRDFQTISVRVDNRDEGMFARQNVSGLKEMVESEFAKLGYKRASQLCGWRLCDHLRDDIPRQSAW